MRRFLLIAFTAIGFFTTGSVPGSMDLGSPELVSPGVAVTSLLP